MKHFYDKLEGFFDFDNLYKNAVKRFVSAERPSTFVELGVYFGRSTAFLAVELDNRCKFLGASAKHLGFDTFDWPARNVTLATKNDLEDLLIANGITSTFLFQQDSTAAADRFDDGTVDFCFVDACHEEEKVIADIKAWLPKIRPGGVLAGHDYEVDRPNPLFMGGHSPQKALWPGVKRAVDALFGKRARIMRRSWWVDLA